MVPAFLISSLFGAGNKISGLPIPDGTIPFGIETPVQQFIITCNIDSSQTQPFIRLGSGALEDITTNGTTFPETEFGFAFRTSVTGSVLA